MTALTPGNPFKKRAKAFDVRHNIRDNNKEQGIYSLQLARHKSKNEEPFPSFKEWSKQRI